jgi:Mce-associated membrane protein
VTAGRRPAWALVLVAGLFCAWSAWSYAQARSDDSLSFGRTRDEVLRAGRQEIADLNSIDSTHIDAGLRRWLDASTGPLREELQRTQATSSRRLRSAGTSARATVRGAAVTELDTRAGSAQLIASIRITVTRPGGTTTTERRRYEAVLARTAQGWKLRSLTAIPLDAA